MAFIPASKLFNNKLVDSIPIRNYLDNNNLLPNTYYTLAKIKAFDSHNRVVESYRIFPDRSASMIKYIFLLNNSLVQNISPFNYQSEIKLNKILIDKIHMGHSTFGMLLTVNFNPKMDQSGLQSFKLDGILYTENGEKEIEHSLTKESFICFKDRILYHSYLKYNH